MRKTAFGFLLFCTAAACFGQDQVALCPRHIETPDYPPIARTAHVSGKITLKLTIDAEGNVSRVEGLTDDPSRVPYSLLLKSSIDNVQHWTFAKPPSAPYTEVIVYDYEFDPALNGAGGKRSYPSITKTTFDLPDRVTITTNLQIIS